MIWDVVERLTGVNRKHIKEFIHTKAIDYVQSNTCQCGHFKFLHGPQTDPTACNCTRCDCNGFRPKIRG